MIINKVTDVRLELERRVPMFWVDVLLGVVFLLSTISGYLKGFIKTLFSLGSYVVAYIITRRYYQVLAEWVRVNTKLNERIEALISKEYSNEIDIQGKETAVEANYGSQMWEIVETHIMRNTELQEYAKQSIETVKLEIIENIVTFLLNMLCMLVLFFTIRIVIMIIASLINKIFELPILGGINRIAGGVLGAFRGIVFVTVIVMILFLVAIYSPEGAVSLALEKSRVVPILIEDILLNLFSIKNYF
ncbi:CvpA family protein [bacterium AH-315-E09]|nr:CvpA family protein [bacterium AH-315-E09]